MKRREADAGVRFKALHRDGFRCVYCGAGSDVAVLHVDHVVPLARGGTNEIANLVAACADCNSGKGGDPLVTTPPARSSETAAAGVLAHEAAGVRAHAFIPDVPDDGDHVEGHDEILRMVAAVRGARLRAPEKILLVMLASRARPVQDEGWVSWPSLPTMALDTGLSERTITRALAVLANLGLVAIDRGTGRSVSRYVLDYDALAHLPPDPRRRRRREA